jgi:hypothetical protein
MIRRRNAYFTIAQISCKTAHINYSTLPILKSKCRNPHQSLSLFKKNESALAIPIVKKSHRPLFNIRCLGQDLARIGADSFCRSMSTDQSRPHTQCSENEDVLHFCVRAEDRLKTTEDVEDVAEILQKIKLLSTTTKTSVESSRLQHAKRLAISKSEDLFPRLSVKALSKFLDICASESHDPDPTILDLILKQIQTLENSTSSSEENEIVSAFAKMNDVSSAYVLRKLQSVNDRSPIMRRIQHALIALQEGRSPSTTVHPAIQLKPSSWPGAHLLMNARTFWNEKIYGPARSMTGAELGVALGVGIWGGLFPMPGATTAVVAALLAALPFAGVRISPPAAGLSIAVNLALTPVQVCPILPFRELQSTSSIWHGMNVHSM